MSCVCPECNSDHGVRCLYEQIEELARERDELRETLQIVEHEVAIVYCSITGGKISKCNTDARTVIAVVDDYISGWISDAEKDGAKRCIEIAEEFVRPMQDRVHPAQLAVDAIRKEFNLE